MVKFSVNFFSSFGCQIIVILWILATLKRNCKHIFHPPPICGRVCQLTFPCGSDLHRFIFQSTLETDLSIHEVCSADFLKDLMTKYDTRLKNSQDLLKKKQVSMSLNVLFFVTDFAPE